MSGCIVVFALRPGPRDKLPGEFGLAETGEDHGLFTSAPQGEFRRSLPRGVLWGAFAEPHAAIAAFDRALTDASQLLGYDLEVERRLAIGIT